MESWKHRELGVVAAMAVVTAGFTMVGSPQPGMKMSLGEAWAQQIPIALASLVGILIVRTAWPAFFRTILAYALASRIPVLAVMLIAMSAGWGTHYEFGSPEYPEMGLLTRWLLTGLMPQMTFWVMFTVVIGSIFGGLGAAIARRKSASLTD